VYPEILNMLCHCVPSEKGVHVVHADQDKLTALKFSDFNLGDRKVYNMLALHKYLTRTKGKNSKIIPTVMDPEPRTVHPTECYEDSALRTTPGGERMRQIVVVKLPWRLFVVEPLHHSGSDIDQSDHRAKHARP
jgi:hypothetical protein